MNLRVVRGRVETSSAEIEGYSGQAAAQGRGAQAARAIGQGARHRSRIGRKRGNADRGGELAEVLLVGHVASERIRSRMDCVGMRFVQ